MSHTNGPWEVVHFQNHVTVQRDGYMVAEVYAPCKLYLEEREANARLIAAAPDLLEALTDLLNLPSQCECAMTEEETALWDKACEAIKRARGEL